MSESEPLLPTTSTSTIEEQGLSPRRERVAKRLESNTAHWAVIFLTALDGCFVIADIAYDFLKDPSCICDNSCPEDPKILEVFSVLSLIITSVFLLEIPLSLYGMGMKHYTSGEHAYLHLFDAIVIVATFTLELFLRGREAEVASLLVLLRLWRLVKLISTVGVGVTEYNDVEGERRKKEEVHKAWVEERGKLLRELEVVRGELDRFKAVVEEGEGEEAV